MRTRLLTLAPLLAAFLALGAAPEGEESNVPDRGVFIVYQDDTPIGTESFSYALSSDTLVVQSDIRLILQSRDVPDTATKFATLVVRADDYDPRKYGSESRMGGHKVTRGLTFQDTAFTAARELDDRGSATVMVRPPGMVFVIDPQVFTMFDVICRNLHGRTFTSRPINLVVLGMQDAVKEATVEDLGTEVVRWGERAVTARKLAISDKQAHFIAWVSPIGRMLRLEAPDAGLRVERQAPPVKPPSSRDD